MEHRVLIVDYKSTRDSFDDLVRAVMRGLGTLRHEIDVFFLYVPIASDDPDVDMFVWVEERRGAGEIALIDNRHLGTLYVQLSLVSAADCAAVADAIGAEVPLATVDQLQNEAARPDADGAALVKLGLLGAPAPDEATTRLVTDGIASSNPVTRERAIYAAFLLKWAAFQQPLAAALEREEREDLRRMLEAAAAVCDAAWPGFDPGDAPPT
jgi:hypothetical protein